MFTHQELAAIAAADAEIERTFRMEPSDLARSAAMDREVRVEALPPDKRREAEQRRTYYRTHQQQAIARSKAYYQSNKDRVAAYMRAYYQRNRDKILSQQRARREAHPELKKSSQEYYRANREKILARKKAYYQANREEILKKLAAKRKGT